jgi:hypothetical protein
MVIGEARIQFQASAQAGRPRSGPAGAEGLDCLAKEHHAPDAGHGGSAPTGLGSFTKARGCAPKNTHSVPTIRCMAGIDVKLTSVRGRRRYQPRQDHAHGNDGRRERRVLDSPHRQTQSRASSSGFKTILPPKSGTNLLSCHPAVKAGSHRHDDEERAFTSTAREIRTRGMDAPCPQPRSLPPRRADATQEDPHPKRTSYTTTDDMTTDVDVSSLCQFGLIARPSLEG